VEKQDLYEEIFFDPDGGSFLSRDRMGEESNTDRAAEKVPSGT
jgi:hypothetical protein